MKRLVFLLAAAFLFAFNARAQQTPQNSSLFVSPFGESDTQTQPVASAAAPFVLTSSLRAIPEFELNAASAAVPADPPQVVYGVKPTYDFQAYLGYTFFRFYEVPHTNINLNGFNYSIIYYPFRLKGWIGADGEFVLAFGSQFDEKARYLLGMGGPRVRKSLPRNVEVWGHGLVGGTHYVPQTSYGTETALAFELGGGIDINTHNSRWSYRIGADAIGSHYFNTYQFSPKISGGIVYKF